MFESSYSFLDFLYLFLPLRRLQFSTDFTLCWVEIVCFAIDSSRHFHHELFVLSRQLSLFLQPFTPQALNLPFEDVNFIGQLLSQSRIICCKILIFDKLGNSVRDDLIVPLDTTNFS